MPHDPEIVGHKCVVCYRDDAGPLFEARHDLMSQPQRKESDDDLSFHELSFTKLNLLAFTTEVLSSMCVLC